MKHWYYEENDQDIGPLSDAEFRQRVNDGIVAPETLVWNPSMSDWAKFSDVEGRLPTALTPQTENGVGGPAPFTAMLPDASLYHHEPTNNWGLASLVFGLLSLMMIGIALKILMPFDHTVTTEAVSDARHFEWLGLGFAVFAGVFAVFGVVRGAKINRERKLRDLPNLPNGSDMAVIGFIIFVAVLTLTVVAMTLILKDGA